MGPSREAKPRQPDKAGTAEAAAGSGSWLRSPVRKTGAWPNPDAAAKAASTRAVQSAASAAEPPAGAYTLKTVSYTHLTLPTNREV